MIYGLHGVHEGLPHQGREGLYPLAPHFEDIG